MDFPFSCFTQPNPSFLVFYGTGREPDFILQAARRAKHGVSNVSDRILQAARRAQPGVSNVSDRILQAARRAKPGVSNVSDRILQAARRAKPDVLFLFPHSLPGTLGAFLRSLCSRWLHLFLLVACVLTGCLRFWHLPAIFNVMASLPIPMGLGKKLLGILCWDDGFRSK